jgi:hypothetical protein
MPQFGSSQLLNECINYIGACKDDIALGLASVTFLILSLKSQPPQSLPLLFHLVVMFLCGCVSVSYRVSSKRLVVSEEEIYLVKEGFKLPTIKAIFLIGSGISLAVILTIRLIGGEGHFEGHAPNLDFGPKHGSNESNIAFVLEFNSLGHWLQGFLASILAFPAVVGFLSRPHLFCSGRNGSLTSQSMIWMIALIEFTSASMSIYPTYNFVKRVLKSADNFATSSFMNNGTEWSLGFLLGLAFGVLSTSLLEYRFLKSHINNSSIINNELGTEGVFFEAFDDTSLSGKTSHLVLKKMIQVIVSCLIAMFTFSVIGAAILIPLTWNRCQNEEKNCLNKSESNANWGTFVGFTLVPFFFIVLPSINQLTILIKHKNERSR